MDFTVEEKVMLPGKTNPGQTFLKTRDERFMKKKQTDRNREKLILFIQTSKCMRFSCCVALTLKNEYNFKAPTHVQFV